jgi:hypothetical protein
MQCPRPAESSSAATVGDRSGGVEAIAATIAVISPGSTANLTKASNRLAL